MGLFEDCLDTAAHRSDVEGDVADGRAYGVSGTPTVFINGRSVSGAIGPDAYEQAILDELRIQSQDRVRF